MVTTAGLRILVFLTTSLAWTASSPALVAQDEATTLDTLLSSPDGRVVLHFGIADGGQPLYAVSLDRSSLIEPSPLGMVTTVGQWVADLEEIDRSEVGAIQRRYELLHGKCGICESLAHQRTVRLRAADGRALEIEFQVSNDGAAFRYRIPETDPGGPATASREATGFRLPGNTRTWLMPMDGPETGWMRVNPAYEAHYAMDGAVGEPSPTGVGWAFPGLFHVPGVGWALITEAGMDGTYVASRLRAGGDGLYRIGWPEPGEGTGPDDPTEPTFSLPFASPWRVIIVGEDLAPIVESSLVTDLSPPSAISETDFIRPGKAAWSWLPLKDESIVPDVQRAFIDMAAAEGYPYVLVDNWWDQNIGYEGLEDLAEYAAANDVGLFVWYNTNGRYNDAPQTPRDRMVDPPTRHAEFERLRALGIRGVKVDFFGGDKQSVIQHYLDIIRDAAEYELLVNVHGATLPRGWTRTYPNFMTAEAVRGYEFITFGQEDADRAATHSAVLPFTRNAVGPMDFTPTMFSERVGVSTRRTSDAFDLAMNVVFESGLQHLGVTPESLARIPDYVRDYLADVPVAWDETRFLDGWPGRFVVLARRKADRWYVAGINAEAEARTVSIGLAELGSVLEGSILRDGEDPRSVLRDTIASGASVLRVEMPSRGGFAGVVTVDE